MKFARGPETRHFEQKLREVCDSIWKSGKQQCEYLSLRGNPCIMQKHKLNDPSGHSSNIVYVSACNCGRMIDYRQDPYTIRDANYTFYSKMENVCTMCSKLEKVEFPVFEPSTKDFKAAPLIFENSKFSDSASGLSGNGGPTKITAGWDPNDQDDLISQQSQDNSSIGSLTYPYLECLENLMKIKEDQPVDNDNEDNTGDDEEGYNEIVIKVGETGAVEKEKIVYRQASTTEYLPGMVKEGSPVGLLPLFPSWSIVCIGPSSVYSHNTGLPEHVQSGFLSGANFLLPWDVQVRLEHAAEWAAVYENRKKTKSRTKTKTPATNPNSVFTLKIFVGHEYECPRGHRFIMSTPEKILRGGSDIVRDSGSKVVFNDMPLYFNCPCRTAAPYVAQLMRIHIVTPKAPVNVIVDPKVRTGEQNSFTFVTGLPEPPKLTQSTYWILRLPYVYEGDDGPILPPLELSSTTPSTSHGYLMAGLFGIVETESKLVPC